MEDTASPPASSDHSTIAASTSKHQKRSGSGGGGGEDDRISRLPDDVLCRILCLFQTKYAVRTSVLSKRWKYLWTSVPNLEFFDSSTKNPVTVSSFINFVDKVLSLNDSTFTRTFRICCEQDYDLSHVDRWVRATVTRDIVYLYLEFVSKSHLVTNIDQSLRVKPLPSSFFNRKNLVFLCLMNIAIKVPASVYFPQLKKMCFSSVQFLDDDSLKNLLSGSPVLKMLIITRRAWDNAGTLYIYSSTLVYLNLLTFHCVDKDSGYKVVIEAPSLRKLCLKDYVGDDYVIENLPLLENVELHLNRSIVVSPDVDVFNDRLFKIVRRVSHVKDLYLGRDIMRSLVLTRFENLPMFANLTYLLVEFDGSSWLVLPHLLECSPNLVTFVSNKLPNLLQADVNGQWHPPHCVPKCLLSSVENIQVARFDDSDNSVVEMIKYFLKNAMVLKKLLISSRDSDAEMQSNSLKQFLTFPRSSSTCQIAFSKISSQSCCGVTS